MYHVNGYILYKEIKGEKLHYRGLFFRDKNIFNLADDISQLIDEKTSRFRSKDSLLWCVVV